jgi:1-pyrroline-5-carboxylate dehydrogenase
MVNAESHAPPPTNEPVLSSAPGTADRATLKRQLESMAQQSIDMPLFIDGKEVRTEKQGQAVMPHAHGHVLGRFHHAGPGEVQAAIDAALRAQKDWGRLPQAARAAIFLKAAELLATTHRAVLNGATMLGQSKTAHQAEIDAACEMTDFFRFNVHFAERILAEQPISAPGTWNRVDARPLEGFVFAVTPFNFTAIGGNLPTAPATSATPSCGSRRPPPSTRRTSS